MLPADQRWRIQQPHRYRYEGMWDFIAENDANSKLGGPYCVIASQVDDEMRTVETMMEAPAIKALREKFRCLFTDFSDLINLYSFLDTLQCDQERQGLPFSLNTLILQAHGNVGTIRTAQGDINFDDTKYAAILKGMGEYLAPGADVIFNNCHSGAPGGIIDQVYDRKLLPYARLWGPEKAAAMYNIFFDDSSKISHVEYNWQVTTIKREPQIL